MSNEVRNQGNVDRYNEWAQPIRDEINRHKLWDYMEIKKAPNGGRICPICGSGTGPNGTGALRQSSTNGHYNRVKCYAPKNCFGSNGLDTLGALRLIFNLTEREAFEKYGFTFDGTMPPAQSKPEQKPELEPAPEPPKRSFLEQIDKYAAALTPDSEGYAYLLGRNITPETMRRFKLGYDAETRSIVIPYNQQATYYIKRGLQDKTKWPKGYTAKYEKPSLNEAGKEPLFNAGALYSSDIVFVVEGPFDAISIAQAGGAAVALCSTDGVEKFVKQMAKKPIEAKIALCLDNDPHILVNQDNPESGYKDEAIESKTEELAAAIEALGVSAIRCTTALMGDETDPTAETYRKDANEILQKDGPEALKEAVIGIIESIREEAAEQEQEEAEERQTHTGAGMVDAFLQTIQTRRYEPVPTGIAGIDAAIGGGFMRQQLVQLGAAPGAGKTALAQWIFENMAMHGNDCIFLNLEMSREQILARSLSRIAARKGHKINAAAVLQGYKWTEEQREIVLEAATEYKEKIAAHMIYNPDGITSNLDTIMKYLEAEAQRAESADKPAPFVVLDYLQIVSGEQREDAATLIKRAVSALKSYAMRHNTTVFVIIAHNRGSNSSGNISMESGRDTSAIEYSADLQLGLTFTKCLYDKDSNTKPEEPDKLSKEDRKNKTLKVTKSRFGGEGTIVDLEFDGSTMTFKELPSRNRKVVEGQVGFSEKPEGKKQILQKKANYGVF